MADAGNGSGSSSGVPVAAQQAAIGGHLRHGHHWIQYFKKLPKPSEQFD